MSLLNVTNLNMRAGGKWVLWDVNLEIGFGEIVGVFGCSDSGKTALARVIAGLEKPTGGTVDTDEWDTRRQVSLALGAPAFASELTVYENLEMFASLWGVPRRKRAREIAFLLEMLGLADARSTMTSELSSGALRRMELARALIADAPLLVIDCLLDTLDSDVLERLWDHLLTLRRSEKKSVLVFTASGRIAEKCGRMAVIHRGRIGYIGRPDDFRRLAGEDMVVLGDLSNPMLRNRIQERLSVVIQEEDGFLSFRVANGERMVSDLLAEFGADVGCVYLKRPTLEDALKVMSGGPATVAAGVGDRE